VRGDGGSTAGSTGISMIQCVDFIIERCRFEYFGNAGVSVQHKDTLARGLIRKNEFYYNAGAGLGYGVVIYGTSKQWVSDPKFGSSNFIFVEDNIFDSHRHSIAAGGCALYVFRYNTVLNNIFADGGHAIDTHEARPGDGSIFGTRAVEIYNNKLLNTTYTYGLAIRKGVKVKTASLETAGIAIRNGEAVVFNNEVKGYQFAATMSNWYFGGTVQPYPVKYGPGYLSGVKFGPEHKGAAMPQGDGDAFFWNNKSSPFLDDEADSSSSFHNFQPDWWKEGRDYHLIPKPGYKPYPYPYPVKSK
ncbi:MAG: right-handed parallel beta-helix repeat-containing protein, partial [Ginsengibacter sp.]